MTVFQQGQHQRVEDFLKRKEETVSTVVLTQTRMTGRTLTEL